MKSTLESLSLIAAIVLSLMPASCLKSTENVNKAIFFTIFGTLSTIVFADYSFGGENSYTNQAFRPLLKKEPKVENYSDEQLEEEAEKLRIDYEKIGREELIEEINKAKEHQRYLKEYEKLKNNNKLDPRKILQYINPEVEKDVLLQEIYFLKERHEEMAKRDLHCKQTIKNLNDQKELVTGNAFKNKQILEKEEKILQEKTEYFEKKFGKPPIAVAEPPQQSPSVLKLPSVIEGT